MSRHGPQGLTRKFYQDSIVRTAHVCKVCGQPQGPYHQAVKCVEDWLRRCDAEKAANQGGK